uniref:(northern house mosquito) hypothetical protein n=1 Tax=Culex pipiens TaxID=7175 RepID=A0A8D8BS89_CULPI
MDALSCLPRLLYRQGCSRTKPVSFIKYFKLFSGSSALSSVVCSCFINGSRKLKCGVSAQGDGEVRLRDRLNSFFKLLHLILQSWGVAPCPIRCATKPQANCLFL